MSALYSDTDPKVEQLNPSLPAEAVEEAFRKVVTLPHASFIGFTSTPIELGDRNTRQVFGDYISIDDVERAIEDKVTVPILYEARRQTGAGVCQPGEDPETGAGGTGLTYRAGVSLPPVFIFMALHRSGHVL